MHKLGPSTTLFPPHRIFNHKESLMTTQACLGIDIAKRTFDAVLLQDGRTRHRQFANTVAGFLQLETWLRDQATAPLHAGLEATGIYGEALALFLHQRDVPVSVINPARTHAFAKSELSRTKTDKTDAALIARFVATQQPPLWVPPPGEQRQLQARCVDSMRFRPCLGRSTTVWILRTPPVSCASPSRCI
jgi:transposase